MTGAVDTSSETVVDLGNGCFIEFATKLSRDRSGRQLRRRTGNVSLHRAGEETCSAEIPQLTRGLDTVLYWTDCERCHLALLPEDGTEVTGLDLSEQPRVSCTARLERECDPAFLQTRMLDVAGNLLLVYETGLLLIGNHGIPSWHVKHGYLDYHFCEVVGRCVVYENDYEGRWAYRLTDGVRCAAPAG